MPAKRKAASPVRPSPSPKKQAKISAHAHAAEQDGVIQRHFYPSEMSNDRCERYNNGEIPRPIELLRDTIKGTEKEREKIKAGECVVHWFKRDLRIRDNKALSLASKKAKQGGVPLVCMFLVSPQDWEAHCTSAARVDFELRTLEILKTDLEDSNIPLYTATIPERKDVPAHVLSKCAEWGAKHVYCSIEYEVDELRREAKLVKMGLEKGVDFTPVHDDVVVPPGDLRSGSGKQYSVYSPWFRAWVKHVHEHPHLLNAADDVSPNTENAKTQFKDIVSAALPTTPENKQLSDDDRKRLSSLWPAGEHEAQDRLSRFLDTKIKNYKDARNLPADNSTSMLSPHLSAGTLSPRTAIRAAQAANPSTKKLDAGGAGFTTWISELAWRDFYKHVLCHWPYVCMSKAFKYEYNAIQWEYNTDHFTTWCEGRTGFPIVDAAMRQMNSMAWMHNRCRMVVASFLAKDLLLDWRLGEKYFMEKLVDGDFSSNNGGWGFSASTGVDPQPYFRIFNPLLQSEKFDQDGTFIRKWVPELAGVKGKAVHDPYGRGAAKDAEKAGYPRPIVDHAQCRKRALERYKEGLRRGTTNVGGGVHN